MYTAIESNRVFKLKLLLWGMLYLVVPLILAAILTTNLAWTLQATGVYVVISATALVLPVAVD